MPGTCQDSIGILLQWPVFLEEPFLGKTPAVHLSKESHQEICPHQDPTKKKTLLQDSGENPARKQNLGIVFLARI